MYLNKCFWTIPAGFLMHVTGKQGIIYAQTFLNNCVNVLFFLFGISGLGVKKCSVHSGFRNTIRVPIKIWQNSRDGRPKSPIIMCSSMHLRMQVLLTSDFGRNPDCNAEPWMYGTVLGGVWVSKFLWKLFRILSEISGRSPGRAYRIQLFSNGVSKVG